MANVSENEIYATISPAWVLFSPSPLYIMNIGISVSIMGSICSTRRSPINPLKIFPLNLEIAYPANAAINTQKIMATTDTNILLKILFTKDST